MQRGALPQPCVRHEGAARQTNSVGEKQHERLQSARSAFNNVTELLPSVTGKNCSCCQEDNVEGRHNVCTCITFSPSHNTGGLGRTLVGTLSPVSIFFG
jgi:hypothetical protein